MEVRFSRQVSMGYCECCGHIADETLSVDVAGKTVGVFFDDGHAGNRHIVEFEVETAVVEAIGAHAAYQARTENVVQFQTRLGEMLNASSTGEERDAAYKWFNTQALAFEEWLKSLGHTVVEEYSNSDSYDEDYYEEDSADIDQQVNN
jgi:hypothetical protein